jgi:hypothetical protein
MDPHSLLCKKCFHKSGATRGPIYRAAHQRGESSLKRPKPPGVPKRAYTKPFKESPIDSKRIYALIASA